MRRHNSGTGQISPRGSGTVAATGRTPDTDPATRFGGQNPELAEPAVSD